MLIMAILQQWLYLDWIMLNLLQMNGVVNLHRIMLDEVEEDMIHMEDMVDMVVEEEEGEEVE